MFHEILDNSRYLDPHEVRFDRIQGFIFLSSISYNEITKRFLLLVLKTSKMFFLTTDRLGLANDIDIDF